MENLKGIRVAILVANGFERAEMTDTLKALDQAGADTKPISPQHRQVRAWEMKEWGGNYAVDRTLTMLMGIMSTRCCCRAAC